MLAWATPGTFCNARSTRLTQAEQVMPPMPRSVMLLGGIGTEFMPLG
jgi:hypothetical protein